MTFLTTRSTARIFSMNLRHRQALLLTRPAVLLGEGRPDTRQRRKSSLCMVLTPRLCFASSVCFGSFKNSFLIDPWSSILARSCFSRNPYPDGVFYGKLELPLLDMLFDLIMSFARSRTCWCWAKRWSWLLPSCCGVSGATIKFTQAFVSFSRLHKRATSFAARYHLEITTLTLTWCSLRTTSVGKVLTDGLPHFTSCDGAI